MGKAKRERHERTDQYALIALVGGSPNNNSMNASAPSPYLARPPRNMRRKLARLSVRSDARPLRLIVKAW